MPHDHLDVGVVVAKQRSNNPWTSHLWKPVAVLPAAPAAAPWTRLSSDDRADTYYAGAVTLSLHSGDTAHYRDNLTSGSPSLWVALRPIGDEIEVALVTADPYEGEALAETSGELLETVPMPSEIQRWIADFFSAFHVERQFFKRKRDRADPEALARRSPLRPKRGEAE